MAIDSKRRREFLGGKFGMASASPVQGIEMKVHGEDEKSRESLVHLVTALGSLDSTPSIETPSKRAA